MLRVSVVIWLSAVLLAIAMPAFSDSASGKFLGQFHFGTLNILPNQVALLHIDAYAGDANQPSETCPVKVQFVFEDVVLQEGNFNLQANRTLDVAFNGPATGVFEVRPVITPTGPCNLEIVPLLQVQEQVPAGTGKTLYIYSGQYSVPLNPSK